MAINSHQGGRDGAKLNSAKEEIRTMGFGQNSRLLGFKWICSFLYAGGFQSCNFWF